MPPSPDRSLPTGTVTFLFTDIEGSTRLLTALGHDYDGLLAAHSEIPRRAIAAHEGVEVSTEGDAFFRISIGGRGRSGGRGGSARSG